YFRHARHVWRALARARRIAGPSERDSTCVSLGLNLELTADGIGFVNAQRAASEPASWLSLFEQAADHGVPVADSAIDLLERNVARYGPGDLLPTPEDRQRLLRFLRPRPGLYARLSEMHDAGVLATFFPELQAILCRVIRDFYHKYTVDEHTLLTIRGLERLTTPEPSRMRFGSLIADLQAPELLVLALLFHDVGKWKDDNHAEESVRMVGPALERLEVSPEGRHDVEFLIAQHLQMSRAAFLRDNDDPAVVQRFATLVGTEERLKMLCLLTVADVEAVSTETLTPWREELLWRLYVDTYNQLTLGYADDVIEGADLAALQASRPPDIGDGELAGFLDGLPHRYLAMFDAERIYGHVRLARGIGADQVRLALNRRRDIWVLDVVAPDRPFLFSNISGVLSYLGMDILRGSAMTSEAGLALDVFQFADHDGYFRFNPGATAEFSTLLEDVVAGRRDVSHLLRRKETSGLYRTGPGRVVPVVSVDNEHSQRYTVLEIVAQDAIGLLHRISRAISQHDCDVELVLIATEGTRAIDVFHLTQGSAKLSEPAQVALKADLERLLKEGYEAH
ncbi:MAG: HD domain-containing protein, partial [Acidimicrobiia bacterium]|nr:HD domain-containing protein [Acidimicrobiia bacterium]